MRSLHGIHAYGFPNAFIVQPTQGANLISNVPHNIVDSARTITAVVRHATDWFLSHLGGPQQST